MDFFDKSTFKKGRFSSPPDTKGKSLVDVLKWKWTSNVKPWNSSSWPSALQKDLVQNTTTHSATWITHSTVLLKLDGCTVLTDPMFSNFAGPFPWLAVKRKTAPSQPIHSLPRIDVVLISHNHYDHLDSFSLKTLISLHDPLLIAPLGNGPLLNSFGSKRVIELDWWDCHIIHSNLNIQLTPAHHWSRRSLGDTCRTLWGGFVIETPSRKIFFAGDTAYHGHFQKIYQKCGPMDLSLLPIGAYEPRWFMKDAHMNPADAVQAHLDLHSKMSVGIHFGTFQLTDEGIDDPINDLKTALDQAKLDPLCFIAPTVGQTFFI